MVKMSDILFVYCADFTPAIFTSIDRKPWIQNENKRLSENRFSKNTKLIPTVTQILVGLPRQTFNKPTASPPVLSV